MFNKRLLILLIVIIGLSFIIAGCDKKPDETNTTGDENNESAENEIVNEPVQAMSIYPGELYFRAEPSYEAKSIGTISKGEIITFMGKTEEGPGYRGNWEYYLVKRLDGSEGWAWGDYIIPDCTPAVTVSETNTYGQPSDVKINMDFTLESMSIIAIIEDNGNWLKVAYENKDKTFWIKPGTLSYAELDIGLANMVNLALEDDDQITSLEKLLEIDAFRDSVFINQIHEKLFELKNPENPTAEDKGVEPNTQEKPK